MPSKEWLEKNKARRKQYQADYYLKNIDRLKKYKREWYELNKKEANV